MDTLRQYIVSVTTAALICALIKSLSAKSSYHRTIGLLCGLFLAISILSPFLRPDPDFWVQTFAQNFRTEASAAAAIGQKSHHEYLAVIIKQKVEAYILDKAAQWNITPEITVFLSDGEMPVPVSVEIRGEISPYEKQRLAQILEIDLGISKENQRWIG